MKCVISSWHFNFPRVHTHSSLPSQCIARMYTNFLLPYLNLLLRLAFAIPSLTPHRAGFSSPWLLRSGKSSWIFHIQLNSPHLAVKTNPFPILIVRALKQHRHSFHVPSSWRYETRVNFPPQHKMRILPRSHCRAFCVVSVFHLYFPFKQSHRLIHI